MDNYYDNLECYPQDILQAVFNHLIQFYHYRNIPLLANFMVNLKQYDDFWMKKELSLDRIIKVLQSIKNEEK